MLLRIVQREPIRGHALVRIKQVSNDLLQVVGDRSTLRFSDFVAFALVNAVVLRPLNDRARQRLAEGVLPVPQFFLKPSRWKAHRSLELVRQVRLIGEAGGSHDVRDRHALSQELPGTHHPQLQQIRPRRKPCRLREKASEVPRVQPEVVRQPRQVGPGLDAVEEVHADHVDELTTPAYFRCRRPFAERFEHAL